MSQSLSSGEAELTLIGDIPSSDASKEDPKQEKDKDKGNGDVSAVFGDDSAHIGELPVRKDSDIDENQTNLQKRPLHKSPAHTGERALVEESEEGPNTDFKGEVTPRDGLSKLTRMNEWLLSDETGNQLSPILWARLRKPFISYLRYTNLAYVLIRMTALVLGGILWWSYYSEIGLWVFVASLVDLFMCIVCEVGTRRVFADILEYASEVVGGDIRSHEDVPNDTIGQSILEGYWWLALLKLCDCFILAVYAFSYPDATADRIKEVYEHDYNKFESRYGDAGKNEIATAATTLIITCAYLAIVSALVLVLAMFLTVKVTTWFEIVQGFVEHVNALGLVFATATCFAAIHAIDYTNSLPQQVKAPNLDPIWAVFGFALVCVPLSIGGFYASWTEHRVGLRVYGGFSAGISLAFLVLLIYFAVEIDLGETVDSQCTSVLKFVHENWWQDGLDCKKYVGSAYRWSPSDSAYYEVSNGVGLYASLSCDTKKDDVYAWEHNKKPNPGPGCTDGCIAYYGCLNRECCDELVTALDQTELIQIIAILFTTIVIGGASISAFYLSNRVHRDNNQSILSHLGAKATLGFMIVVILAGAIFVAIDAAQAGSETASTAYGLGDLSTNFGTVANASSSLDNGGLSGDGSDATADLAYNESCLTDSYLDDRTDTYSATPSLAPCASDSSLGYCTPFVWLSPPLLLPSCTECSSWSTSTPDLGCSSEAAKAVNPTMTCVSSNSTCSAANEDGSCGSDDYVCLDPGYDDRADTNGECKAYSGALAMVVPSGVNDEFCSVEVTVEVNHGGELVFCEDGTESATCNETLATQMSGFITPSSAYYEDYNLFTVSGTPSNVAATISNFSFCPSCISVNYQLFASIKSMNESACIVNEDKWNLTIRAATNLNQVIVGSVIDGTCAATSTACWDGSAALTDAEITGELTCSNVSTTAASDGSFSLTLPYMASEHGSYSPLTYSAPGFLVSSGISVELGASSLNSDSSRYQWISANLTEVVYGGGYCMDMTTRTYVDANYCAAAGVDMCAIYASMFTEGTANAGSQCTCYDGDTLGTCSSSDTTIVCDGCRLGSSGYCADSDGYCYDLTVTDDGDDDGDDDGSSSCVAGDKCENGWPCLCDSTLTENVHFIGYTYLFPVPTQAPTQAPTLPPSSRPTLVPIPNPTAEPTLKPTPSPTSLPSPQPTPMPTSEPTPEPTSLPTHRPSSLPTPFPTIPPSTSPSQLPTINPTPMPTPQPSPVPTPKPSFLPTSLPTSIPTPEPSGKPTGQPSPLPTPEPSISPTQVPTSQPTPLPTMKPSPVPIPAPTSHPSPLPTARPSPLPTIKPTPLPTLQPTPLPIPSPSQAPTALPTIRPTALPTIFPTSVPSVVPIPSPTPHPSALPTAEPTSAPSLLPIPVPTAEPSPNPTSLPTETTVDIAGIVVRAIEKTALTSVTVTVTLVNAAYGVSETQTISTVDASFSFAGLPSGTYAMTVSAASGFNSYTRLVVANSYVSSAGSNSENLLIPLAKNLRGNQMLIVAEWGASVGSTAYSNQVGVPTDLDLYLKFAVSADEECLVYYNSPACGYADLLSTDALSEPTVDDIPYSDAIDTTGVEILYLNPMIETTYTLWVRNSNLDQPIDTAGLKVNVYTADGLVKTVVPPPPCGNATGYVTVTTDDGGSDYYYYGDDYHNTIANLGITCPYHDTPLTNDGSTDPFWSSDENIENSEYLRVLCMDYATVTSNDDDSSYTTLTARECQRYMSSTAFGYVSLDETCPPSDLDLCTDADDGYWRCSNNIENGIYSCPGGAATMVFCGEDYTCTNPRRAVSSDTEDPTTTMCI